MTVVLLRRPHGREAVIGVTLPKARHPWERLEAGRGRQDPSLALWGRNKHLDSAAIGDIVAIASESSPWTYHVTTPGVWPKELSGIVY